MERADGSDQERETRARREHSEPDDADHQDEGGEARNSDRSDKEDSKKDDKPPEDPAVARRKKRRAIIIACIVGAVILVGAGIYGAYYYRTGRYLIETDDAYTQADNVIIAAQVTGYVQTLLVTDNQQVHRGQVLARIDARVYQAEVGQSLRDRPPPDAVPPSTTEAPVQSPGQ